MFASAVVFPPPSSDSSATCASCRAPREPERADDVPCARRRPVGPVRGRALPSGRPHLSHARPGAARGTTDRGGARPVGVARESAASVRARTSTAKTIGAASAIDVNVIDDWGLSALTGRQRHDIIEVIEDRHAIDRRSSRASSLAKSGTTTPETRLSPTRSSTGSSTTRTASSPRARRGASARRTRSTDPQPTTSVAPLRQ